MYGGYSYGPVQRLAWDYVDYSAQYELGKFLGQTDSVRSIISFIEWALCLKITLFALK